MMASVRANVWCARGAATVMGSIDGAWVAHAVVGEVEASRTMPYHGHLEASGADVDGEVDLRLTEQTSCFVSVKAFYQ